MDEQPEVNVNRIALNERYMWTRFPGHVFEKTSRNGYALIFEIEDGAPVLRGTMWVPTDTMVKPMD